MIIRSCLTGSYMQRSLYIGRPYILMQVLPANLSTVAPDVLAEFLELNRFEHGLKTPCWVRMGDGQIRCLPYFSIIGVTRTSSTTVQMVEFHNLVPSLPLLHTGSTNMLL